MATVGDGEVLIRVEASDRSGRQINRGLNPAQSLRSRRDDIAEGIAAATEVISSSVSTIARPAEWSLDSVEAKFGITLGAEGSVIISKATVEASFEVTVCYRRDPAGSQSAPIE